MTFVFIVSFQLEQFPLAELQYSNNHAKQLQLSRECNQNWLKMSHFTFNQMLPKRNRSLRYFVTRKSGDIGNNRREMA